MVRDETISIGEQARLLRGEYGESAHAEAMKKAKAFGQMNMPEAFATWERVANTILALEKETLDVGTH